MTERIQIGDISVDVIFKEIKNLHLSVHPPTGRVRIAAPRRMKLDTVRVYAISKIDWIRKNQKKIQKQERETPREYLERESHYVWGKRYLLVLKEANTAPYVELQHNKMVLTVRPGSSLEKREAVVAEWYRAELRKSALPIIAKWETIMGVKVEECYIQRMKTKWGSCNSRAGSIRLNSELAKKPVKCLEYIVVHEMAHLLAPTHNQHFFAIMDKFMYNWRQYRDQLNQMPLAHVDWEY